MLQSSLFTKSRKESPKDEVSKNADLLIRAGFIHKEMAGVYTYLPLGLKVLNKINTIIREEMNLIGGQEVFMTSLQSPEYWQATNRWSDEVVDNWFKTKLKSNVELGLAFTHEESLTNLMKNHIHSYRDLPQAVYQIQTKFRNETRAKSGIMRGREFLMKDLYSFSLDEDQHQKFYEQCKQAYLKIFTRLGIGDQTYLTYASGGSFSKYSHEFQTLTEAGEDLIYICDPCHVAVNKEIILDQSNCPLCGQTQLREAKAVEVGNIFSLGTKFSSALDLKYIDESGMDKLVVMGSYGIGPGRLMGTIVELFGDDKGLIWPRSVAPFDCHLLEINPAKKDTITTECRRIYQLLADFGYTVLWDDRDNKAGEKFAESDLYGVPVRLVISEKTMQQNMVEIKLRKTGDITMVTLEDLERTLSEYLRL